MKILAIASCSLLLAACTVSQTPSDTTALPAGTTSSDATSDAPTTAVKRMAVQENVDPMRIFRAFGTEPFWNVSVQGDQLTLTMPEDQSGMVMDGQRVVSADGGVDISGSNDAKTFSLSVRPGACSDGMSDNQYDMTSIFHMGDIHYTGCAEAAK